MIIKAVRKGVRKEIALLFRKLMWGKLWKYTWATPSWFWNKFRYNLENQKLYSYSPSRHAGSRLPTHCTNDEENGQRGTYAVLYKQNKKETSLQ